MMHAVQVRTFLARLARLAVAAVPFAMLACASHAAATASASAASSPAETLATTPATPTPSSPPLPAPEPGVAITARPMPLGTKIDTTSRFAIEALFTVDGPNGPVTVEDYGTVDDHRVMQLLLLEHGVTRKLGVRFLDHSAT